MDSAPSPKKQNKTNRPPNHFRIGFPEHFKRTSDIHGGLNYSPPLSLSKCTCFMFPVASEVILAAQP